MTFRSLTLHLCVSTALLWPAFATAQQDTSDNAQGLSSYAVYKAGEIDNYNPVNGNLFLKIPLLSYPQKGHSLALSFSIYYNANNWRIGQTGTAQDMSQEDFLDHYGQWVQTDGPIPQSPPPQGRCTNPSTMPPNLGGVYIARDQAFYIGETCYNVPYTSTPPDNSVTVNSTFEQWFAVGADGSKHQIGDSGYYQCDQQSGGYSDSNSNCFNYDSDGNHENNQHILVQYSQWYPSGGPRSGFPDGSLLSAATVGSSTTFNQPPTAIMDGVGNTYTPSKISDGNGNAITINSKGWQDSYGRDIPGQKSAAGQIGSSYYYDDLVPGDAQNNSSASCPMPSDGSNSWTVPAPGGTAVYLLCYKLISIATDFNAYDLLGKEYEKITESNGSVMGLAGIVLPDGSYYAFTYDSYASLTLVRLPTGATISYQWTNVIPYPGAGGFNTTPIQRRLASKTVHSLSDAGDYTTAYTYNIQAGSPTSYTIVTEPDGHDEQHEIVDYGQTRDVLDITYAGCAEQRPGCGTPGTILKAVQTDDGLTADHTPWSASGGTYGSTVPGFPGSVLTIWPLSSVNNWNTLRTATSRMTRVDHTYIETVNMSSSVPSWEPAETGGVGTPPQQAYPSTGYAVMLPGATTYYDGLSTDTPTPLRTDLTRYIAMDDTSYTDAHLINLPSQKCRFATAPTSGANCIQYSPASETLYRYDAAGNLTATVGVTDFSDMTGVKTQTTYNSDGSPSVTYDGLGNGTTYGYSNGFLTTVTDTTGTVIHTYTRDKYTGLVLSDTDANGQQMSYGYDGMRRVTSITHPDYSGYAVQYSYNPYGGGYALANVVETDAIGLDASNNLLQKVTTTYVDGLGRLNSATLNSDPGGASTVHTAYNTMGQVGAVSTPYRSSSLGPATYYAYDALGRLTSTTDPMNAVTNHTYAGEAETIVEPSNGTASRGRMILHNVLGQIFTVCEFFTATQNSIYSGVNSPANCSRDMAGSGIETSYLYDTNGNLTQVWDGNPGGTPFIRRFQYDSLSRLTAAFNPEAGANPAALTNGTTYSYDNNNRVQTRTRLAPNAANIGSSATVTTTYSYNNLNQLTAVQYSDGTTPAAYFDWSQCVYMKALCVSGGSNLKGRIVDSNTRDANGNMLTGHGYSYDAMGRTLKANQCTTASAGSGDACNASGTNPGSAFLYDTGFSYNYAGDLTAAAWNDSHTGTTIISYGYNTAGQLNAVTSNKVDGTHPGTLLSNVAFDPAGHTTQAQLGAAETEVNQYDNAGRWYSSVVSDPANTQLYGFYIGSAGVAQGQKVSGGTAGRAPNGDVLCVSDQANNIWNYTYDEFDRVKRAELVTDLNSICTPHSTTYNWSYDIWGNMVQSQGPTAATVNQKNNQMIASGLVYDNLGNVVQDTRGYQYTYDAESRLTSVVTPGNLGGETTYYQYDENGQRVVRSYSAATTDNGSTGNSGNGSNTLEPIEYVYDLSGRHIADFNPSTAALELSEIYAGGRHLATYAQDGNTYFIHSDWLGTERARTLYNGTMYQYCSSLPFGDNLQCTTTQGGPVTTLDPSAMHFTGKERDVESGNDYFGARYYGSSLGRFLSPDWSAKQEPVPYSKLDNPQTMNLYAYTMNNPINAGDPDGHFACANGFKWGGDCFHNVAAESAEVSEQSMVSPAYNAFLSGAESWAQQQNSSTTSNSTASSDPIATALSNVPGVASVTSAPDPTRDKAIGGHQNETDALTFKTPENQAKFLAESSRKHLVPGDVSENGFGPGVRLPGGLHAEQGHIDPHTGQFLVTAHIDRFNANNGLAPLVGHFVVDVMIGMTFFHHSAGLDH